MKRQKIQGSLLVSDTDPLVREHRLDGIHILPGVAMLDALYRTLEAAGHPASRFVLRNILFHEPVVTQQSMDRYLTVTVNMDADGGDATIRSQPARNGAPVGERDTLHLSCRILPGDAMFGAIVTDNLKGGEDLDACYSVTRQVGIQHDDFMKCRGRVRARPNGGCEARVTLGSRALDHLSDFLLHPVFLDCSTVVPLFGWHTHLDDAQLFIPFGIDEFQATSLRGRSEVVIRVDPNDADASDAEFLKNSFTLYSTEGMPLVRFRNFTVKRVRSLENVRHLLTSGQSARHRKAEPASAPVEVSNTAAIEQLVRGQVEQRLERSLQSGEVAKPFFELGLDSLSLLDMAEAIEARLGIQLYPTLLFEHASVSALVAYLNQHFPEQVAALGETIPAAAPAPVAEPQTDALSALIVGLIKQSSRVELDPDSDAETSFFELGLDSMVLLDLCDALSRALGLTLYPTLLFEHASLSALTAWLRAEHPEAVASLTSDKTPVPLTPTPSRAASKAIKPAAYVPRWEVVLPRARALDRPRDAAVALVVHPDWLSSLDALKTGLNASPVSEVTVSPDADEAWLDALLQGPSSDQIWCIGIDHTGLFRLLRGLIDAGRLAEALHLKVVSCRAFSVQGEPADDRAAHGLWGLLQTATREYPELSVTQLDVPDQAALSSLDIRTLDTGCPRQLLAVRQGRCYQRRLLPTHHLSPLKTPWRSGGVYLIIGGSGGIGRALLTRLCEDHGARVAILGRRPVEEVPEFQALAERFGDSVRYLQGHADREADLAEALANIQFQWGPVNGIVHAAMVLHDQRLAAMSEADFNRVLQPKVEGIRALSGLLPTLDLDFLLVFSSLQSFVGNVAQGNYAAASTFVDGCALALGQTHDVPVRVVNWGVWGDVGAVATDVHRELLSRQGMVGMATTDALDSLDETLAAGWDQTVIAAAEPRVLTELGFALDEVLQTREPTADLDSLPTTVVNWDVQAAREVREAFTDTQGSMDRLMTLARQRLTSVFKDDLQLSGPEDLSASSSVRPEFHPLVEALFEWLASASAPADSQALDQVAFEQALDELCATDSDLVPFIGLLRDCLNAYPDILTGRVRAADVVFPQGRIDAVQAVYGDNAVSGFYNQVVAEQVASLAESLDRPLRVLEVGAGTGATTRAVLNRLAQSDLPVEYQYTELWDTLLLDAKARFGGEYANLRFDFLDINSDPRQQGFTDPYDVVIATNVLHATRQLATSLQHVKSLLCRGGRLVLNESVVTQPYSTLTFGLLPGWWHAIDVEERLPHSPLVSREGWQVLLKDAGFEAVTATVPGIDESDALAVQEVLVATSNGEARLKRTDAKTAASDTASATATAIPANGLPDPALAALEPVAPESLGMAASTAFRTLRLYRDANHHLWLFLDNPPANTYNEQGLGELCRVLECVQGRPDLLADRLLYISHMGPYFSLGGDRTQIAKWVTEQNLGALQGFADKARRLMVALSTMDVVVVGVVNGSAQGGGLETLFATDLQVVRSGVGLGLPEIKSGLVPGMGGMTYLKHQIGLAPLKRLLLGGNSISAQQAHALGLVSHLADNPFEAALALGDQLDHLSTAVMMKRRLNEGVTEQLTADIDYWLDYLHTHGDLIDLNRILQSEEVLARQTTVSNQSTT